MVDRGTYALMAASFVNLLLTHSAMASDAADPAGIAFFETHVRPILVAHCYECHANGEANGGLAIDSRRHLLQGGDSGPAASLDRPAESLLLQAVRYTRPELQMPPKSRLTDVQIAALQRWIELGLPDPRTSTPQATSPAPTGMSIDEGRQFWSFQPVRRPMLPMDAKAKADASANEDSPIDLFLSIARQSKGLSPAPRADARSLIRRVTYDLTGLPPSASEVEQFLADPHPDAWERLSDRLLASPSYAVRWGRHWLDVARYADSNGLDENLALGNAWRYRDYVVNAFNTDKPFDQFAREQLAGDLLPDATDETRTATGFFVLGAKVLAEPDREKLTMDTIDEQLDTLGKAFWGMTIGCVRCHDHKFDPLKQEDYYGLAAIMKSTKTFGDTNTGAIKHWNEFSLATPAEKESLKQIDAEIARLKDVANNFKNAAMEKIRQSARSQAIDYLVAATEFGPDATLVEIEAVAKPRGLHPRILAHCRKHLEYHRDDPFFAPWHERWAKGDIAGMEQHYRSLLTEMKQAWDAASSATPPATSLSDLRLEQARAAIMDLSGFLAVPPKAEFALDPETLAEFHRLSEEARIVESRAADEPAAMAVQDQTVLLSLPIHVRGSHLQLGNAVPRTFPAVMRRTSDPPDLPADRSGRLELADWMTRPDHPLTARVFVNRLWRWHFGVGLVASVDNFGALGEKPTHPELLDWLAQELIDTGYSTKSLHRVILSSEAYRQAVVHPNDASNRSIDADNRYYWRWRLARLDAEQIRDAVLFVSGRLDQTIGGKTVPLRNRQFVFDHTSIDHTRYDSVRRALYLPIIRNNLYPLFEQFDFPDPTMPTGSRHETVVAPQALLFLNADLVIDSAEQMARDLLALEQSDLDRLDRLYRTAFARPPTHDEQARAMEFLSKPQTEDRAGRWALFCQAILASNEFIYLR
jgi:hypothetical protein